MGLRKYQAYAITWSPPDNADSVMKRYKYLVDVFQYHMSYCAQHYIMYPEFAGTRLHFHGTLVFSDHIKFVRSIKHILSKIGYLCIKPLESLRDKIKWNCYCRKEWSDTQLILRLSKPILWCTTYRRRDNMLYVRDSIKERVIHRSQMLPKQDRVKYNENVNSIIDMLNMKPKDDI